MISLKMGDGPYSLKLYLSSPGVGSPITAKLIMLNACCRYVPALLHWNACFVLWLMARIPARGLEA